MESKTPHLNVELRSKPRSENESNWDYYRDYALGLNRFLRYCGHSPAECLRDTDDETLKQFIASAGDHEIFLASEGEVMCVRAVALILAESR